MEVTDNANTVNIETENENLRYKDVIVKQEINPEENDMEGFPQAVFVDCGMVKVKHEVPDDHDIPMSDFVEVNMTSDDRAIVQDNPAQPISIKEEVHEETCVGVCKKCKTGTQLPNNQPTALTEEQRLAKKRAKNSAHKKRQKQRRREAQMAIREAILGGQPPTFNSSIPSVPLNAPSTSQTTTEYSHRQTSRVEKGALTTNQPIIIEDSHRETTYRVDSGAATDSRPIIIEDSHRDTSFRVECGRVEQGAVRVPPQTVRHRQTLQKEGTSSAGPSQKRQSSQQSTSSAKKSQWTRDEQDHKDVPTTYSSSPDKPSSTCMKVIFKSDRDNGIIYRRELPEIRNRLLQCMLDTMQGPQNGPSGPELRFSKSGFVSPGWLLFTVESESTREWLLAQNVRIDGVTFTPIRADKANRDGREKIVLWLKSRERVDISRFKTFIGLQNRPIDVSDWRHVETSRWSDGWLLKFIVGKNTIKQLESMGWKLSYEFISISVTREGAKRRRGPKGIPPKRQV